MEQRFSASAALLVTALMILAFVPLAVAQDTDADGMPDSWETTYGLDPNFAGDAFLDSDADGYTNYAEYMNGTDPTVAEGGAPTQYMLSIYTEPYGAGSVTLSPAGGTYNSGTSVTLTATPNTGYTFSSWSGGASGTSATTTVTMDANKSVTANFTSTAPPENQPTQYSITTSASPSGAGYVSVSPSGPYSSGASVTLTATPYTGYTFSSWSGDASGTSTTTIVTMDANKSVTANFTSTAPADNQYQPPPDNQYQPPPDVYICPYDGLEFSSQSDLEAHMQSAHAENYQPPTAYICPYDGLEFSSQSEFNSHMQTAHPEIAPPPGENFYQPPEGPMAGYFCPFDGAMFNTPEELDTHIATAHPGQTMTFFCPFDGLEFTSHSELDAHIASAHAGEVPTFTENFVPPTNWMPSADNWGDWTPHENYIPTNWNPEQNWIPPENWFGDQWWPEMQTGEMWVPSGDWTPPTDWMPAENWIPPENWMADQWWPTDPMTGGSWHPLEDNWMPPDNWMPDMNWRPPEEWWPENFVPSAGWMPPVDWVPPSDNFLPNVVPPWMSMDSWQMPENWMPFDDWVPIDNWRPPEFHIWVCPVEGLEFDTVEELDAHLIAEHPEITEHPCPFDFSHGPFSTVAEVDAHIRSEHAGEIPTLDQIPGYTDLFMPMDLLAPPQEWLDAMGIENYQLPPLDNLPFFVPPWLDPTENHWVPPENRPFWTWEQDNIEPGSTVNIYITENYAPVVNTGGGAWTPDPTAAAGYNVLVGGVQINVTPTATQPLDNVITTVLNLDTLPENIAPPAENYCQYFQVGTNIPDYIENAEVGFRVDRDWIAANNLDENTLVLDHYEDGAWEELETTITGRDENYVYCSAATPSFSVFAVTGEKVTEGVIPTLPTQPAAIAPPMWVIAIAAIAMVAVLLTVIWKYMSRGAGTSKSMKRLEASLRKHWLK